MTGLFAPRTPALEVYPNVKPSKALRESWQRLREARVANYRAGCLILAAIIVQHAGDLLEYRAQTIAACTRRSLSPDVLRTLKGAGQGLAMALLEAFKRIDWLPATPYLRSHNVGDPPPPEFGPLSAIVEAALSPLRLQPGLPLRPPSGSGQALTHCPLASECWPSVVTEQRIATHHFAGMRWERPETVSNPHPVQVAFRTVSEAASLLDAEDIRGGGKT